MDPSLVHDILEKLRHKFKKNPIALLEDDLVGTFSQILGGVLITKDIMTYIHQILETIGELDIISEFNNIYKENYLHLRKIFST